MQINEEEQNEDLKKAYELLAKHIDDDYTDINRCYVFWQCFELMRKYYENKPLY